MVYYYYHYYYQKAISGRYQWLQWNVHRWIRNRFLIRKTRMVSKWSEISAHFPDAIDWFNRYTKTHQCGAFHNHFYFQQNTVESLKAFLPLKRKSFSEWGFMQNTEELRILFEVLPNDAGWLTFCRGGANTNIPPWTDLTWTIFMTKCCSRARDSCIYVFLWTVY